MACCFTDCQTTVKNQGLQSDQHSHSACPATLEVVNYWCWSRLSWSLQQCLVFCPLTGTRGAGHGQLNLQCSHINSWSRTGVLGQQGSIWAVYACSNDLGEFAWICSPGRKTYWRHLNGHSSAEPLNSREPAVLVLCSQGPNAHISACFVGSFRLPSDKWQ